MTEEEEKAECGVFSEEMIRATFAKRREDWTRMLFRARVWRGTPVETFKRIAAEAGREDVLQFIARKPKVYGDESTVHLIGMFTNNASPMYWTHLRRELALIDDMTGRTLTADNDPGFNRFTEEFKTRYPECAFEVVDPAVVMHKGAVIPKPYWPHACTIISEREGGNALCVMLAWADRRTGVVRRIWLCRSEEIFNLKFAEVDRQRAVDREGV